MQTLKQLKRRAKQHGMIIRQVRDGAYRVIDVRTSGLCSYPDEISLEGVEAFLDGLDGKPDSSTEPDDE